ncbi:MAG: hypothetical protein JO316_05350 [Abitibacteriaceae bacterium]|nr:hypothetical protein [Abditibacteriaceae bacterium]
MHKVSIATVGLALLFATTAPGPAQPPAPVFKVFKVTIDTIVTCIELPAAGITSSGQAPTWTVKAASTIEDAKENTITFNGPLELTTEGVTITADKLVLDKGKNMHGPISLTGKVVIAVSRNGHQIMQISAAKATLQTEEPH